MNTARFRMVATTVIATGALLISGQPAQATEVTVTESCRAKPPLMAPQYSDQSLTTDVTAPATVAPKSNFDIVVTTAPQTVPSEVNGYQVKEVKNITAKFPIPANSTYVRATLSGGNVPGPAPTLSVVGNDVIVKIAGPIPGGATYQVPVVTATLKSGARGTIETRLGGTSYDDPGITFTAVVNTGFYVNVPVACYPNPNPVITTTTIG